MEKRIEFLLLLLLFVFKRNPYVRTLQDFLVLEGQFVNVPRTSHVLLCHFCTIVLGGVSTVLAVNQQSTPVCLRRGE